MSAGLTEPAVYARIKAGDTGDRLWRKKEKRGRHCQMAAAERAGARVTPAATPSPAILRQADAMGLPRTLVQARFDAGWPQDRLLDLPKRWRRSRRHLGAA